MRKFFLAFLKNNSQTKGFLILSFLIVSLVLTLNILPNNTDNRQRASGQDWSTYYTCRFAPGSDSQGVNSHTNAGGYDTVESVATNPGYGSSPICPPNAPCVNPSDSNVTWPNFCSANQYCDSLTSGAGAASRSLDHYTYYNVNTLWGVPQTPCVQITSCKCTGTEHQLGGKFSCTGNYVGTSIQSTNYLIRNCGKPLYCDDRVPKDQQQGVWPCTSQAYVPPTSTPTLTPTLTPKITPTPTTAPTSSPTEDKRYYECSSDPSFGACGKLVTKYGGPVLHLVTHDTSGTWYCHDDDTVIPCLSSISGHVFIDTNGNGTQDSGEPNVTSDQQTTLTLNPGNIQIQTDQNGNFTTEAGKPSYGMLTGGDYTIEISTLPNGYQAITEKQTVSINFNNRNPSGVNFGIESIPTPTDTLTPTPTIPEPTPTIGPSTADITVHYEGIDKDNTPMPGGQNHKSRKITLFLYLDDGKGSIDFSKTKPTYISSGNLQEIVDTSKDYNGYFRNTRFPLGKIKTGNYFVLIKAREGSLVEQVGNNSIQLMASVPNILVDIDNKLNEHEENPPPTVAPLLRMGDIVSVCDPNSPPTLCTYNKVDILDYNALKDCIGNETSKPSYLCSQHNLDYDQDYNIADLNDDGLIDGVDYTILLKHFNQYGVGGISQNGGKD